MKAALTAILMAASLTHLSGDKLPLYKMEPVKTFITGSKEGELGVNINKSERNGPAHLTFDKEGNLYIADIVNNRIVLYNSSFEYKESYERCLPSDSTRFFIEWRGDHKVLTWSTEQASPKPERQPEKSLSIEEYMQQQRIISDVEEETILTEDSLDREGALLKKLVVEAEQPTVKSKNHLLAKVEHIYLGSDKKGFQYWQIALDTVYITNKEHRIVKRFRYDNNGLKGLPAIHPSGDIYLTSYNKAKVVLYRIRPNTH